MENYKRKEVFCTKEKVKCLCAGCPENKTNHKDGRCEGCKDCGRKTDARCLVI